MDDIPFRSIILALRVFEPKAKRGFWQAESYSTPFFHFLFLSLYYTRSRRSHLSSLFVWIFICFQIQVNHFFRNWFEEKENSHGTLSSQECHQLPRSQILALKITARIPINHSLLQNQAHCTKLHRKLSYFLQSITFKSRKSWIMDEKKELNQNQRIWKLTMKCIIVLLRLLWKNTQVRVLKSAYLVD